MVLSIYFGESPVITSFLLLAGALLATHGVSALTPTPPPTGPCGSISGTISAPFSRDSSGSFCWQSNNLGSYINSWNLSSLTVNNVDFTNVYVPSGSYPAQIGGYWYVGYNSSVAWGHFETGGTSGPTNTPITPTITLTPTPSLTSVAGGPDLQIVSVVAQQNGLDASGCALNRNNYLLVTIQNAGGSAAGAFEVSTTGRNFPYRNQAVPGLAPGASIVLTFKELPTDGVNVITVDSTGIVTESNEANNTQTYNLSILPSLCTATPTPIGWQSPTPTATGTPPCATLGQVSFDHTGGAGMVNIPIMAASNTGTPNPGIIATTGPYGSYITGCVPGKAVYGQLSGFNFSPTSVNISFSYQSASFVAKQNGLATYTPTTSITPTPTFTPTRTRTATATTCTPPTAVSMSVAPVTSPTSAITQVILVSLPGGNTVTVTSEAGSFVQTVSSGGVYSVTIDLVPNSTNHLQVQAQVNYGGGCSYILTRTTDSSGNPLNIVQTSGGVTNTPTPTPTPTRTPTPTPSTGTCSPVDATISAPFTKDGAGTLCWQSSNLGSYINSWNTSSVTLNGVNVTNVYVGSGSYPAQIGGYWYVVYNGPYAWSHFEAK